MALPSVWSTMHVVVLVFSVAGLLSVRLVVASQDSGSAIPAESRPCVDCHAFEFMQRALQDLKKTAYNLDTRVNTSAHGNCHRSVKVSRVKFSNVFMVECIPNMKRKLLCNDA
ncbi:C4orf48 [Columba livia]|nr:C4orf48 [Columba livia]